MSLVKLFNKHSEISPLLRWLTGVEVLVLIGSGVGLFLLPSTVSEWWPWGLLPFNIRFLGAVYSASMVAAGLLFVMGRWSPARIVTPMILGFTVIVLGISILENGRFDGPQLSVIGWFALYMIIPTNAAYHVWLYRERAVPNQVESSGRWRTIIGGSGLICGIYGLGLLILPSVFGEVWAWPIDNFHARMYSVAFLTPAIGLLLIYRAAMPNDLFALGWTMLVGGVLSILG
jgi:hypothetical protein